MIVYHSTLVHAFCSCGAQNQSRSQNIIDNWIARHLDEGHSLENFYETAEVLND